MFLHNKRMMHTVRVEQPDPRFAKLLLEQFGGPNGELAAAFRYFTQGWNDPDPKRRDMLLDIATEELSHLEMVAQTLAMLLKGSPADMVDKVEGDYLGELLDGKAVDYTNLALTAATNVMTGGGPRLTDSAGNPWTSAYIDTLGEPQADLRSDIAAEARAKIVYERLIKFTDDPGITQTLNFLMTREVAHQKMFEAALSAIPDNFPPGQLQGDEQLGHAYIKDADSFGSEGTSESAAEGFRMAQENSSWGFSLDTDPVGHAATQEVL